MSKNLSFKKKIENVQIIHSKIVCPEKVQRLYSSVGWSYRDCDKIQKSLENSFIVTTAWSDKELIGIGRATGDGVFNATIWDLAVKPDWQNCGVGKLIVNSMLTKLDDCGISLVTLYTSYTKKHFYSKLGFEINFAKVIGMYKCKNQR